MASHRSAAGRLARAHRVARSFAIAVSAGIAAACSQDRTTNSVPSAPGAADTTTQSRPNLIFFLADDMRWDAMGVVGNPIVQTPNLDALARKGVLFRNAYVTTPICAISRASIFTGQFASRHGILDFHTDFTPAALAQTYPVLLRKAGYRTGFIGKHGVGDTPDSTFVDHWRGFAGGGYYETKDSAGNPIHLTHLQGRQAIAFLKSQPKGKPFALSVSFKAPHVQDDDPRQFIPETVDLPLYEKTAIPSAIAGSDLYWNAFPEFFKKNNLARDRWGVLFSTPAKYQKSVKGYYQLITGMDRAIGEIEATLENLKLADNTVIIFSSDNGFFLGELGMAHKWYGQEPSVRVPLIMYDPRDPTGQGGRFETAIALNIDIAPTLLDLAHVTIPSRMQGRSLLPLLHGTTPAGWRTDFYMEHMYNDPGIRRSVGVVGGRYKYLKYVDPTPNYEYLYDLVVDPSETRNFAADSSYQTILAQLRQRYSELAAKAR